MAAIPDAMRSALACGILALALTGCTKRADREPANAERRSADTVVVKREMRDTGIIRHDTTISTDTIRKRGTRPVKTDTVKKP
jgi:hypothetical protein